MSIFKKFEDTNFLTTEGRVEQIIVFKRALADGYFKIEDHFFSGTSSHGYFATNFDNLPTSPWSNRLSTITYGMHSASTNYTYASASAIEHKSKIYRLYAKALLGDEDAQFLIDNKPARELIFISAARNQMKDGLVPGSVGVGFYTSSNYINQPNGPDSGSIINNYYDTGTQNFIGLQTLSYKGGRAGYLIDAGSINPVNTSVGIVFYDHGTAVLMPERVMLTNSAAIFSGTSDFKGVLFSGSNSLLYGLCGKFSDFFFKSFTKPKITFFKCIAEKEEFNYSSNPSYIKSDGQIIVASGSVGQISFAPKTYITQIGLVNDQGEILAVAKLTQPVVKDFDKKLEITVRLIT